MKYAACLILIATAIEASAFSLVTDVTSVKAAQKLTSVARVFSCKVEYIAPDKLNNQTSFGSVQVFAADLHEANMTFLNRSAVLVSETGDVTISGRIVGASEVRPRLVDFDCALAK